MFEMYGIYINDIGKVLKKTNKKKFVLCGNVCDVKRANKI